MSDTVYVAWQDDLTRRWKTIARLTRRPDGYELVFTAGVRSLGNLPSNVFRMEPGYRYRSSELLEIFKNRIPPRSRSDFTRLANWLGVDPKGNDFALLSRFGLIPGSDSILVYPAPSVVDGMFELDFFVHGLRYMHTDASLWCENVSAGQVLLPMLDIKNVADPSAVALRDPDGSIIIGYVPAFYASDIASILRTEGGLGTSSITILRANKDAPVQLKLLCRFKAKVSSEYQPFSEGDHVPIINAPTSSTTRPNDQDRVRKTL